jgi:pentatricopeptide repeat protein
MIPMEKLRILSSTLAEIYIRQGHFDKARDIYEKLLARETDNSFYRSRLSLLSGETPDRKKLKVLSLLLKKVEEKRDERQAGP